MGPPYWPVSLKDCPARLEYRSLEEGQRAVLPGGIILETMRANHPGRTLLYRITAGNKKIVYGLDCEMDGQVMEALAHFARDADLMICDAQYSPEDYPGHRGWGHSTWQDGVRLAKRCGAKRCVFPLCLGVRRQGFIKNGQGAETDICAWIFRKRADGYTGIGRKTGKYLDFPPFHV